MKTRYMLAGLFLSLLTGCWTVSETEFPSVTTTAVPEGKSIRVRLANFRTGVYTYIPVEGHETMAGASTNVMTGAVSQTKMVDSGISWGLQSTASGCLVRRAVDELQRRNFTIDAVHPDYLIEVRFSGPVLPDDDALSQVLYGVCTLCTAENTEVKWSAKLFVRDPKTDKILFAKEYEQDYEVTVWGPIPVASPATNPKVTCRAANSWALTALCDRVIADATAFLADQAK